MNEKELSFPEDMSDRDKMNALVLMTMSERELALWWIKATIDDVAYASELLIRVHIHMTTKRLTNPMMTWNLPKPGLEEANTYLSKFRLNKGKEE